jgi:lipoate-protein ligase A
MTRWQLIVDGAIDGIRNMAIDAALLEEVQQSARLRTIVRFYGWRRPAISLGRNQNAETAVDGEYCGANGIDIVRRPTGGRAVLHDDELTYAVISNDSSFFGGTIYGNYRRVSEALCIGYNTLGVPAILAPETRKISHAGSADPPCFISPSRYELMAGGRKIAGSAQRRVRGSFLQHGSMPITCNREALARATRMSDASVLEHEMAGIAEFVTERPAPAALTGAFIRAFQEYFSIEFEAPNSRPVL